MMPVLRDAQARPIWRIASELDHLATVARDGTAKFEELSGSNLAITSLGPLGGIATTPVINRPEVAIIGPNRIVERPVYAADGLLEKRKVMNVSISCERQSLSEGSGSERLCGSLGKEG
jgi:2-oxoisovalerate dehydrogenase E2 component (dihydrolipoyl transacylase)